MGPGRFVARQPVGDVPPEFSGRTVGDVMLHAPEVIAPTATVADLRAFFDDDHVHAALVVDATGRLLTVVERCDLQGHAPDRVAAAVGRLSDRTLTAETDLPEAWLLMRRSGRRRLAVVEPRTELLLGLLCLERSGLGFCTDAGVAERRAARGVPRADRSADPP